MKLVQKYLSNTENPAPNTGEMLKVVYKKRRISEAALGRKMNRRASTLASFEKNTTIQTAVLWEICHALKHNFFLEISAQLPADYATNAPIDYSKDERITKLEREIELLKAEKAVLLEALKG